MRRPTCSKPVRIRPSWGGDISNAQSILRTDPMVLFYPSAALAITVLAFIMMGDAVKDALDPKSRTA